MAARRAMQTTGALGWRRALQAGPFPLLAGDFAHAAAQAMARDGNLQSSLENGRQEVRSEGL